MRRWYPSAMEILLHPPDDASHHPPDPTGRLSTAGHGEVFRAFAGVAERAGIRFMVIGGTFRDVAVRAGSTRDIDVVLIDAAEPPEAAMTAAGSSRSTRAVPAYGPGARLR